MKSSNNGPIRLLFVDDEPALLDSYREIFRGDDALTNSDSRRLAGAKFPGVAKQEVAALPDANYPAFELEFCLGAEAAVAAVAKSVIDGRPFAVAFLDMRMGPGPDGLWAATRIRGLDPQVEIVVCTAYSDVDPAQVSLQVPPVEKISFLQKPFHPHEVRQAAISLSSKWRSELRVARLAYFDPLTGLGHRAHGYDTLASAIDAVRANGQSLAVLHLDIDNFKRINDTLGPAAGDEVLVQVARRLEDMASDCGVTGARVFRLGGDEFLVMLPGIDGSAAATPVAERMLEAVVKPVQTSKHRVLVTASVGVSIFPTDGADAESLVRHADLAMHHAKRLRPGTHQFFDAAMNEGVAQRFAIEEQLRGALERGEFRLHYQPQIDVRSGNITGLEALMRWTNPHLGVVPPNDFVPVAEQSGLIVPIGEWVLRAACTQAKRWQDAGLGRSRIAVNVASQQFAQDGFYEFVERTLKEVGLDSELLELEITESMAMSDEPLTRTVLERLHNLGVKVAIDDFGTGYSNFARLKELDIDRLKLDRSFVKNLDGAEDDRAIANAIIAMAAALKVEVVAEGVESFGQLWFLQEANCSHAQGFLISRPLPVNEVSVLLKRASDELSNTQKMRQLTAAASVATA